MGAEFLVTFYCFFVVIIRGDRVQLRCCTLARPSPTDSSLTLLFRYCCLLSLSILAALICFFSASSSSFLPLSCLHSLPSPCSLHCCLLLLFATSSFHSSSQRPPDSLHLQQDVCSPSMSCTKGKTKILLTLGCLGMTGMFSQCSCLN
jgi:hypothetical protein